MVPTPELGEVGAVGAVGLEAGEERGAVLALGADEMAALEDQRLGLARDRAVEAGDHRDALAAQRGGEALAARQVPERPGRGQEAVVREAGTAADVEAQIGAGRAGDARLVGAREQLSDRAAARGHRVEVDRHEAREEVGGDAGERRAPDAGLGGGLAGLGVRERLRGRRDEDVDGRERGGDRRRRLAAVLRARVHEGEHGVGAGAGGLRAQRLGEVARALVADDEDVLAGLDRQAAADDGLDGEVEVGRHGGRDYPAAKLAPPAGVAQSVRAAES